MHPLLLYSHYSLMFSARNPDVVDGGGAMALIGGYRCIIFITDRSIQISRIRHVRQPHHIRSFSLSHNPAQSTCSFLHAQDFREVPTTKIGISYQRLH